MKPSQESRGRFNSLDLLLGNPKTDTSVPSGNLPARSQTPNPPFSEIESTAIPERARSTTPTAGLFFRSATPTVGGLLAPPDHVDEKGSIALRAIRSMRSLARMGSWAQSSSMPTAQELAEEMKMEVGEREKKEHKKDKGKKREKDGTIKEKKSKKGEGQDGEKIKKKKKKVEEEVGTVKKKTVKKAKEKEQDKATTMRISTSSFEVGHLSASPVVPKTLGSKKHSILGLGLPSTIRLPRMRGGSTASSLNLMGQANPGAPPASAGVNPNNAPSESNRLSVENITTGVHRAPSVTSSNGSSLRPVSVASSNSRLSTGSSVVSGTSVRWDEDGLEAVREQRRKERDERRLSEDSTGDAEKAERRTSKESRRSSGGQRRTPLSSIFPEVQHHPSGAAVLQDVTEEDSKVGGVVGTDENGNDSDGLSMMSANTTSSSMMMRRRSYGTYPILTIEEATADGHDDLGEEEMGSKKKFMEVGDVPSATPVKRRIRPLSEQLLGRARPKAIHEDEDGWFQSVSVQVEILN